MQRTPANRADRSMVHAHRTRSSVSRRALLISSLAGLASIALPRRGIGKTAFVLPGESANRRFAVFYKGDKIGAHTVLTTPETGEIRVNTEIDLVVKALFFTLFSFSHSSEERWRNGKLVFLKGETVEHGEKLFVEGAPVPQGFRVVSKGGPFIAPADALTSNSL